MKIVDLKDVPSYLSTLAAWHFEEWNYMSANSSLAGWVEKMKVYLEPEFIPTTFVALDNELLGSAAIVQNDMDTRMELGPWLASVYVEPMFRKRGMGSRLVHHVMSQARKNGIKKLYLFTPDQEEFYKGLGWKELERTYYRGCDVTIMYVDIGSGRIK